MRFQNNRQQRHVPSWRSLVLGIIFAAFLLFFLLGRQTGDNSHRVSVVVASSPVTVWSWNTNDNTFTALTIPSDYVIDALYGYGEYSLDAVWRLGYIDKKKGLLLSGSLSDTLGLPIGWYIGTQSQTLPAANDVLGYGRSLFSLANLSVLGRRFQTNMPLGLFIAFSRALSSVRPDKIQQIDLERLDVVNEELLPDGTTRKVISPDLLDHALGGVFENDALRKEGLSVAVYNTTSIPSLGNRASRVLTHAGVLVVTVGNDEPLISQCELSGSTKSLSSRTAAYMFSLFGCKKKPSGDNVRADLIIHLGSDYAKRFSPSAD